MDEDTSGGDMMNKAQQVWSMLDDMADSNPAAYHQFIEKQMKEGKDFMKQPEPHMCVQSMFYSDDKISSSIYINVFAWTRVTKPKDHESPIPVFSTPIIKIPHQDEEIHVVNVAFNPSVCEEYGRNVENHEYTECLINLAMEYIQDMNKADSITISRHYTILGEETTHKGDLKTLIQQFTKTDKKVDSQLEDLQKQFAPMADVSGPNENLMDKLSTMASPFEKPHKNASSSPDVEIKIPGTDRKERKKGLIEELDENGKICPSKPEYKLDVKEAFEGREERIVVKIQLPGVRSVDECQLDVSRDDLSLVVPNQAELKIKFPKPVDDNKAKAKFSTKSNSLTITLPVC